jgi:glycosyltransferase involved in cell wall biosynthesis
MSGCSIRRVVLVTPWYGLDTAGGAEVHARRLVESLQQAGVEIEVFTSTGKDFFTPEAPQYYPAGRQEVNGVPVWRFSTREDDGADWLAAHVHLLEDAPPLPEEERHLIDQLIAGDDLYARIAERGEETLFLFMPYVWGTTFWGSMLARERAVLIPCLHDEPYARYEVYKHLFRSVFGVLFNSKPEMELAQRLYDLPAERARVVGEGLDMDWAGDADRFRQRFGMEDPFVFYVGRRDRGKRVPLLIEYFCAYKDRHPGSLKLVLAGKNPLRVPLEVDGHIIDLGYISEQDKHDAYAAAALVCNPSLVESFSLIIMEAWLQGTPVLVNAECDVTVHHCRQSDGGLFFSHFFEFEAALAYLLEHPVLRRRLGAQGQKYVLENYAWPQVVNRVLAGLDEMGIQISRQTPLDDPHELQEGIDA